VSGHGVPALSGTPVGQVRRAHRGGGWGLEPPQHRGLDGQRGRPVGDVDDLEESAASRPVLRGAAVVDAVGDGDLVHAARTEVGELEQVHPVP
jgi:hypothetical protein